MNDNSGLLEILRENWQVISGCVIFVVGYTQLHVKSRQNTKDIEVTRENARRDVMDLENRQEAKRREDMDRLENTMKEVRTDIKTLLGRH